MHDVVKGSLVIKKFTDYIFNSLSHLSPNLVILVLQI